MPGSGNSPSFFHLYTFRYFIKGLFCNRAVMMATGSFFMRHAMVTESFRSMASTILVLVTDPHSTITILWKGHTTRQGSSWQSRPGSFGRPHSMRVAWHMPWLNRSSRAVYFSWSIILVIPFVAVYLFEGVLHGFLHTRLADHYLVAWESFHPTYWW